MHMRDSVALLGTTTTLFIKLPSFALFRGVL
jgi:hypothetical protein